MELAWTAFGAGSVPVGAVLLDGEGAAVASGRNRMYEQEAPPPQIANSRLAHAEVNALIGLSPGRRYEDHLVTALEPCPLSIGAVVLSTVGTLTYLGGDPYAGAVGSFGQTPHTRRVPLRIRGPRRDPLGGLASAPQIAWYLQRIPDGHVVRARWRRRCRRSGSWLGSSGPRVSGCGSGLVSTLVHRLRMTARMWAWMFTVRLGSRGRPTAGRC